MHQKGVRKQRLGRQLKMLWNMVAIRFGYDIMSGFGYRWTRIRPFDIGGTSFR